MVELVVRLVFSLAVVIGMLLLLARFSAKRFRGSSNAPIRVVHRQALSRSSSVAVVTIGSRVLVLGTTEQQVQLLTELDPEELEVLDPALESELDEPVGFEPATFAPATTPSYGPTYGAVVTAPAASIQPAPAARERRKAVATKQRRKPVAAARPATTTASGGGGPLAGSLLSAQTWKPALAAAPGRGMDLT